MANSGDPGDPVVENGVAADGLTFTLLQSDGANLATNESDIGIVLVSLDIGGSGHQHGGHPDSYDRDRSEEQAMRTVRRFVKEESGMTMGLAIIMILLLGVMGAGLLTFVSRDLNTVIEENRGRGLLR